MMQHEHVKREGARHQVQFFGTDKKFLARTLWLNWYFSTLYQTNSVTLVHLVFLLEIT